MRAGHARRTTAPFTPPLGQAPWSHLPWVLVYIGVGVMVGLLITATTLTFTGSPKRAAAPPEQVPAPQAPAPVVDREPFLPPGRAGSASPESAGPPSASASAPTSPRQPLADTDGRNGGPADEEPAEPRARPERRPAPAADVTGTYRVLQGFTENFIGEVLIKNNSGSARHWTVQLRFSGDVGQLFTVWVEGAPTPRQQLSGGTWTFTGAAAVPARSSQQLRFQFDQSGPDIRPKFCTTNGTACR